MRRIPALAALLLAAPLRAGPAIAETAAEPAAETCPSQLTVETIRAMPGAEREHLIACRMREGVRAYQAALPRPAEGIASLDKVTAAGPTLTFHYKVAAHRDNLAPDALGKPALARDVCATPDMPHVVALRGAYCYAWRDYEGHRSDELRVESC